MAKHKHYDMIKEWIKDTSRGVECRDKSSREWLITPIPIWSEDSEYRFYDEFRELKEAYQNGAKIQHLNKSTDSGKWFDISIPSWIKGEKYRIKPEYISIDDFINKIRGQWVKRYDNKSQTLIIGLSRDEKLVNLGVGIKISFDNLIKYYEFLDGSPIPKYEGYK